MQGRIDVGGTFTDVVLEAGGVRTSAKVLTTSQAPEKGVIDGLQEALQKAGLTPDDVGLVLHGTTLATNAVLERRGARTAFITTEGFRDILEVGYETRYDQLRPDDREGEADRAAPAALHRAGARRRARAAYWKPSTKRPSTRWCRRSPQPGSRASPSGSSMPMPTRSMNGGSRRSCVKPCRLSR